MSAFPERTGTGQPAEPPVSVEPPVESGIALADPRRAHHHRRLRRYRLLLPILILVAFLTWSFTTNYIPSPSMLPALKPGDHVLTMRAWLAYPNGRMPARGDIVVFALPSKLPNLEDAGTEEMKREVTEKLQSQVQIPAGSLRRVKGDLLIKRVVGLPGETIRIKGRDIYVNDQKLDQKFFGSYGEPDPFFPANFAIDDPITLKQDEVFVLGDNIENSEDGRVWGPLKRRNIVGKFMRVLWNDGGEKAVSVAGGSGTADSP